MLRSAVLQRKLVGPMGKDEAKEKPQPGLVIITAQKERQSRAGTEAVARSQDTRNREVWSLGRAGQARKS